MSDDREEIEGVNHFLDVVMLRFYSYQKLKNMMVVCGRRGLGHKKQSKKKRER